MIYGAWLMPLGFFAGGVYGAEGDPALGVLLVPLGGVLFLIALLYAALSARS